MNKIIIIFSIWLTPAVCLAGLQLATQNYEWYLKHYKYVNSVLESDNAKEVIPIINTLGTIWKFRDGAIGSEISGAIAKAMIHHPKYMFGWFISHPVQLDKWIERIPYDLLTNYASVGHSAKLKTIKKNMERSLPDYIQSENNSKLKNAAIKVLSRVKSTEVREID